jgi:hypothetical protein
LVCGVAHQRIGANQQKAVDSAFRELGYEIYSTLMHFFGVGRNAERLHEYGYRPPEKRRNKKVRYAIQMFRLAAEYHLGSSVPKEEEQYREEQLRRKERQRAKAEKYERETIRSINELLARLQDQGFSSGEGMVDCADFVNSWEQENNRKFPFDLARRKSEFKAHFGGLSEQTVPAGNIRVSNGGATMRFEPEVSVASVCVFLSNSVQRCPIAIGTKSRIKCGNPRFRADSEKIWCGRRDLNPHGLSATR